MVISASIIEEDESLSDIIPSLVDMNDNLMLCSIPDEGKIYAAIRSIGPKKAPGANGMSRLFFRIYWSIVKVEVINTVQTFSSQVLCLNS